MKIEIDSRIFDLPSNIRLAPNAPVYGTETDLSYGIGIHPGIDNISNSGIAITGDFHSENRKEILETMTTIDTKVDKMRNFLQQLRSKAKK